MARRSRPAARQSTIRSSAPPPSRRGDDSCKGQANTNNPSRYQWRVERKHGSNGTTTLTAVGERIVAYLHHGSLDVSAYDQAGKQSRLLRHVDLPPTPTAQCMGEGKNHLTNEHLEEDY
jgi:hypothetical protein